MSPGYHTSWKIPEAHRGDPLCVEAGAAIALGQAVYDRRTLLGLDQRPVAERAGLSTDEIENIEEGGGTPTLPLLRSLAIALETTLDLMIDTEQTRVIFESRAA